MVEGFLGFVFFATGACSVRGWPHLSQNFLPDGFMVLHFGHIISCRSGLPQSPQNSASSRFSNWQFGHFMRNRPPGAGNSVNSLGLT